jgi:hypothetical protein
MQLDQNYRLSQTEKIGQIALVIGLLGLILSLIGYFLNPEQFFFSYLAAFAFWTSIGLGALFFVMLQYLTGSIWSISSRRIPEALMSVLPWMSLFFLVIIIGMPFIYHWSGHEAAAEPLFQKKSAFLNMPFFIIRSILYFTIWTLLIRGLLRNARKQDDGFHPEQLQRSRRLSAGGMVLFAFTLTFAAIDWLMSLNAEWYSTIFGVYFFTGSVVGALAGMLLIAIWLRSKDILSHEITFEHYHDLGKLIFTFMILWAYMAFSQYFLIWYANLPEETAWFKQRWQGSWRIITLALVFGHFFIPFVLLMSRAAKRNTKMLFIIGIWFLAIHRLDIYWVVMPNLHHDGLSISWMDFSTMAGIGGVFVYLFWRYFTRHLIIPVNDPQLQDSIHIINH